MKNNKRCIWTELKDKGYSEEQIHELFLFMENLPVVKLSDEARNVTVHICKGHIVLN